LASVISMPAIGVPRPCAGLQRGANGFDLLRDVGRDVDQPPRSPSRETAKPEDSSGAAARPRAPREQLAQAQFHCGTPPPAAEPRTRTITSSAGSGRRGAHRSQRSRVAVGDDDAVIGALRARGIGRGGVARQQERLAAAAAEIFLAPVARAARFGHPRVAAKRVEGGRRVPRFAQRRRADVGKLERPVIVDRALAGQHASVGASRSSRRCPSRACTVWATLRNSPATRR
jgi:hypothetical protein